MGILFFFFNDTATTEIYTLSLHDALPISEAPVPGAARHGHRQARQLRRGQEGADALGRAPPAQGPEQPGGELAPADRKSTRLNSSHVNISYAVFCLKKNIQLSPCPSLYYS